MRHLCLGKLIVARHTALGLRGLRLDQVPAVPKDVSEDSDSAVNFCSWGLFEGHACGQKAGVFRGKVIRIQEQPHAARALIADGRFLSVVGCFGQDAACTGTTRCDPYPAFVALINVLAQREAERATVVGDGSVIVWHDQGDGGEVNVLKLSLSGEHKVLCSRLSDWSRGRLCGGCLKRSRIARR